MFTKFRVRNFKTHLDTEIELKDLTLLIGSNNSGKTNLLKAISFFSDLIKESNKPDEETSEDYVYEIWGEHFHKLFALDNLHTPTSIELTAMLDNVPAIDSFSYCIEIVVVNALIGYDHEYKLPNHSDELELKETIRFFRKKILIKEFNNQSIKLNLNTIDLISRDEYVELGFYKAMLNNALQEILNTTYLNLYPQNLFNYKADYGKINFFNLLSESKQSESEYDKVMSYLRRFEESLIGINIDNELVKWSFDMGNNNIAVLDSDEVSDGLLKATAIALICASEHKPSIIMIDEIENGINQHNLVKLIGWLKHVSNNGKNTQFILTSHSPSVIREFSDNLNSVYTVHLKRKKGYVSEVTNLNEALKMINRLGGLKEESVEEVDGVLHIRKYALTELFYNGILGEL